MGWINELSENITRIDQIKNFAHFSADEERKLREVVKKHPFSVTKYYLSLIDWNDKNDPIRKMIIPSVEELDVSGSYDTSGEAGNTIQCGLQHKYSQTALILSTNVCGAYCRFCFRKRMVGLNTNETLKICDGAVEYIKRNKEIDNVLISGGDSLMLSTDVIKRFLFLLSEIPHVKYIRFGSRIPVVFPNRILKDDELLSIFSEYSKKKKIYIISHFNHPRELTNDAKEALSRLLVSGVRINNQTVLMKGVNDTPHILGNLFNGLISSGVLPYYVFQCRPVSRVKNHFAVPLCEGIDIFERAKKMIKGHILCKRLKYVMSHPTGKIEIIGKTNNQIVLKHHQPKDKADSGRLIIKRLDETSTWLDELADYNSAEADLSEFSDYLEMEF